MEFTTKKAAAAYVGGLSKPSKMPGKAYGLPARECKVGSKLVSIPGSVCSGCYALKGQYRFSNVQAAQYRRLETITAPHWVDAMVYLLRDETWFRWHDAGDLQDLDHLLRIVDVAIRTPHVNHWLPTREKALVKAYRRNFGSFPANMVVRVSDAMVDHKPDGETGSELTSGVTTKGDHTCPAYAQGGECRDCRSCWSPAVQRVTYPQH